MKWIWFLNWKETEEFHREDYYLAQIAADVTRPHLKKGRFVSIKDKLLKFTTSKQKGSPVMKDPETKMQQSKNFWRGLLGLAGKGK